MLDLARPAEGLGSSDDETRYYAECRVELDGDRRLVGYPIVFGRRSLDLGGFVEEIAPSAVDRTLSEALDVRALIDHDPRLILGRQRAGTLALRKDRVGLYATIEPDFNISYVADLARSIKRGDVTGMSFRFRTMPGGDDWNYDGATPVRTVTDAMIREVSIVTFPAYLDTSIALRSLTDFQHGQAHSRIAWRRRRLRNLV